jgi:hypothetical protein
MHRKQATIGRYVRALDRELAQLTTKPRSSTRSSGSRPEATAAGTWYRILGPVSAHLSAPERTEAVHVVSLGNGM